MYVTERFELNPLVQRRLKGLTPNFRFGLLGEVVYSRTYSRIKADGNQETWSDTVIRVVNGLFSIRKDWYIKHHLRWDESYWQQKAAKMADAIFHFRMLPPGRGLWIMGSPYLYEKGAAAAYNCAFVDVTHLSHDAAWAKDFLMCGIGVGFGVTNATFKLRAPKGNPKTYVIPDTREGWVESVRLLIEAYEKGTAPWEFDYSQIRPAGAPIRGFGGVASGYQVLETLHIRLREYLNDFVAGKTTHSRLIADVMNAIGACVVAGNVRRSAEIMLGRPDDNDFLMLKDFSKYDDEGNVTHVGSADERLAIGGLSNNSVVLSAIDDFLEIPHIAQLVANNGEPGFFNLLNIQKYGRYAEEMPDQAIGANPCAEIPLESYETCNLSEVFPTNCNSDEEFFEALELATLYASTVSLLPTHSEVTNAVIARNRRIGVSLSGIADWFDSEGATKIISLMRKGYRLVRQVNQELADEAGVPASVRVTTVKPSGSISQLAGVSSGMHYPPYTRFIRRIRVGMNTPIAPLLIAANIPHEPDKYSEGTWVFEFPVETRAKRTQRDLSMWQKGAMVILLQRHWADNMVSNTITFDPKTEGHQVADFLAHTLPFVKTLSLLPDSPTEVAYEQMPYEAITKAEYDRRSKNIRPMDWTSFTGSDGEDSRFCTDESCEV